MWWRRAVFLPSLLWVVCFLSFFTSSLLWLTQSRRGSPQHLGLTRPDKFRAAILKQTIPNAAKGYPPREPRERNNLCRGAYRKNSHSAQIYASPRRPRRRRSLPLGARGGVGLAATAAHRQAVRRVQGPQAAGGPLLRPGRPLPRPEADAPDQQGGQDQVAPARVAGARGVLVDEA